MSPADSTQRPIELILLRQLASYLDMPTFVVDAAGELVYFNGPAESLLGVRFDEVGQMESAQWLAAFQPGDEAGATLPTEEVPILAALHGRRPVHRQLWISGLDGIRRPVRVTAFPIVGQGAALFGAVAIFWVEADT